MDNLNEKLEAFAILWMNDHIDYLRRSNLDCPANIQNGKTSIKYGKKYTKVDIGTSGRYMVENETGIIYGIKAYGQIHKGYSFGTLDTINQYYWGNYTGTRK